MRNDKSNLANILALALLSATIALPVTTWALTCYDVRTTPGTDVSCNECYETGSPFPHMANCGGPSYHIDTYTSCVNLGTTWFYCIQTNAVVGRTYTCVATPNQPQINYCETTEQPACILICVACFTTLDPFACAGCALCIINLSSDCVGCALVICARSPDYTPINGHQADAWEACRG